MANRVNLSIDEDLIKRAKKFAIDQGTSLSAMFESYLKKVLNPLEGIDSNANETTWITDLHGAAEPQSDKSDEDLKYEYLKEKYLR